MEPEDDHDKNLSDKHAMVLDKDKIRHGRDRVTIPRKNYRNSSRSRSPRIHDRFRERTPPRPHRGGAGRSDKYDQHDYSDRSRRR